MHVRKIQIVAMRSWVGQSATGGVRDEGGHNESGRGVVRASWDDRDDVCDEKRALRWCGLCARLWSDFHEMLAAGQLESQYAVCVAPQMVLVIGMRRVKACVGRGKE